MSATSRESFICFILSHYHVKRSIHTRRMQLLVGRGITSKLQPGHISRIPWPLPDFLMIVSLALFSSFRYFFLFGRCSKQCKLHISDSKTVTLLLLTVTVNDRVVSQLNLVLTFLGFPGRRHFKTSLFTLAYWVFMRLCYVISVVLLLLRYCSVQLKLRCLIHMELAKCEEDVEHLSTAVEHVKKVWCSTLFIFLFQFIVNGMSGNDRCVLHNIRSPSRLYTCSCALLLCDWLAHATLFWLFWSWCW